MRKKERNKRNKRAVLALLLASLLALLAIYFVWPEIKDTQTNKPAPSKPAPAVSPYADLEKLDDKSVVSLTAFAAQYDDYYHEVREKVRTASTADWKDKMLDDAYFVLLYASQSGLETDVEYITNKMILAQRTGVNLDDNTWGIDQAERSELAAQAGVDGGRSE